MHLKPRRIIPYSYYRTVYNQNFENTASSYVGYIRLNFLIIASVEYIIWNYNILLYYNYIIITKNTYLINIIFHNINYLFADNRSMPNKIKNTKEAHLTKGNFSIPMYRFIYKKNYLTILDIKIRRKHNYITNKVHSRIYRKNSIVNTRRIRKNKIMKKHIQTKIVNIYSKVGRVKR
jgi:hypothetical protein